MSLRNDWNPAFYDNKLGFVSEFGKGIIEFLHPQKGESILDLGCGTGDLTNEIRKTGANVTGMDLSESMIKAARKKYPEIDFMVGNAEDFRLAETFDAVFSNAALHWMLHAEQVAACVWKHVKKGGRFVAEFGGKGNVQTIIKAMNDILSTDYGMETNNPWYFPSIGEYSSLLETQGFRVVYAAHFDRPTELKDGEIGLHHWLNGFAGDFFKGFDEAEKNEAFQKIAAAAKNDLFRNGSWYADYKRIRILAVKP